MARLGFSTGVSSQRSGMCTGWQKSRHSLSSGRGADLQGLQQGRVEGEQLQAFEAREQRGCIGPAHDLKHGQQGVAPPEAALHNAVPVCQHQQQIPRLQCFNHHV